MQPMSKEQMIQYAKKHGLEVASGTDASRARVFTCHGCHIFNKSNAKVYVAEISGVQGVLVIYAEEGINEELEQPITA